MNRPTAAALLVAQPLLLTATPAFSADEPDPYLWLEEVTGERAMAWVKEQNERSTKVLEALPEYRPIYDRTLAILDSKDRIPMPGFTGDWIYNFWQDPEHPRGILRRTSLASYKQAQPEWETVLDIDAMSKEDGVLWVYQGKTCLAPKYERCLVNLSKGGSDAAEVREFDLVSKEFVEGGFRLPEAKSGAAWKDQDTLWVGTDWGAGSLTRSGYPRIVKAWTRGTKLEEAKTIYETSADDVGVWPITIDTREGSYSLLLRKTKSFFEGDQHLAVGDRLVRLELPLDADFKAIFRRHAVVALRSDWTVDGTTYPRGALLALPLDSLMPSDAGGTPKPSVLFTQSERVSLDAVATTRDQLLYTTLDNVKSRLYRAQLNDIRWTSTEVALPGLGAARIVAASDDADRFFVLYEDFLTPDSLHLFEGESAGAKVKSLPELFDAKGLEVSQHEATSKDGTRIPYFLVGRKGLARDGQSRDGNAPTLIYAYGGFEVSYPPNYSGVLGAAWLERGGVYALANIRGGGEFGPAWHEAAVRENHHRNFEDLAAVAEDLIARKITSPKHLGIMGGSQGGLLVGGAFVLRPELYGAVVCQVPLLDMKRYSKMLAGASWVSEYGDPDVPADWEFMRKWSPYQLVKKDAKYPEVFFWTTTKDDRVHPGHARKMVAKMLDQGHPVLYFEVVEGGHGAGSVNTQKAKTSALEYAYLWWKLK